MKYSSFILASAAMSMASPIVKRQDIDATVLQFALTLEHLENVFYKEALGNFTESDFLKAGFSSQYYNNLKYVAADEESHVKLLTAGLTAAGAVPVQACSYNFKFTDPKSFVTLSSILEGVGTSAYLGGAPLISSKAYLSIAGSILITEALHTSYQRSAIGRVPFANPYGTALNPNEVYTLASAFITSCPSTNAPLPFTAFPSLTAGSPQPVDPGREFYFIPKTAPPAGTKATFVNGLNIISKTISNRGNGKYSAVVPAGFGGQTYVLFTNGSVTGGPINDTSVLFGPAIIEVKPAPAVFSDTIL